MNVLIDLRWMVIGRTGGLEQMAYELVASVEELFEEDTLYLFCSKRAFCDWLFKAESRMKLIDSDLYTLVPERVSYDRSEDLPHKTLNRLGLAPLNNSANEPKIIYIDLVHSIGGYVHDELLDYRNILTVHDLQHIHLPHHFDAVELASRNARYLTSIRASESVISVSDTVNQDIVDQYGVDSENVTTIWNIPSGSPTRRLPKSKVNRILRRMGIDYEFLYFPSHGWPHKNHLILVEAFGLIRESLPDLKLVFTGGKFSPDHPAAKKIQTMGLGDSVFHIGYRTPAEMQCLYQGAKALVYPSKFEGFGMPVAEAIEAGTPVICSNIGPLVEVGDGAIVTFEPNDPKNIADKVLAVLRDDKVRQELRERGEKQRKRFSSSVTALNTYNLYRKTCGLNPIVKRGNIVKPNGRRESTRHWGRVCERKFKTGDWVAGVVTLLVTAWFSLPLARAIWGGLKKENAERDFHGRYGDGWIGSRYRDWFIVPCESKGIELKFEAPPFPHASDLEFRVTFEGIEVGAFRFDEGPTLRVPVDFKERRSEIVQLEIDVNRSFRPNEHEGNGDERDLAIKLVEIRWILAS